MRKPTKQAVKRVMAREMRHFSGTVTYLDSAVLKGNVLVVTYRESSYVQDDKRLFTTTRCVFASEDGKHIRGSYIARDAWTRATGPNR